MVKVIFTKMFLFDYKHTLIYLFANDHYILIIINVLSLLKLCLVDLDMNKTILFGSYYQEYNFYLSFIRNYFCPDS